ncbi:unnamed protein product [Bursaphelenchus xylophilus]|uniref:mitogen-activated protein kinase kinase n=1 Tax=Bursaphelenchus xylophilus TaxID=6326 RepID=A0A1I7STY7_BURXY|nr:unnamed protein product [Bursaphelenchus xylophilus]CAG9107798.1 unnamed protein product [Bursaphelenchus xylophilus]
MMNRTTFPGTSNLECDDHVVPDGSKDIQFISNSRFVQMFMSGKLMLPCRDREMTFGYEDLENIGEIGAGRFGIVCKMRHVPSKFIMAVKRVRLISNLYEDIEDQRRMRQLQNEVQMIKEASTCPEVVRFYGVTFHEGDCLICMELMDISLDRLYNIVHQVARTSFDENVLGSVGVTVLKALDCLKKLKHIIHRDVKPSNILLNCRGKIKICDFGISGYLEDSMAKTKDVGCRPYMAPERLMASIEGYDTRSDVWSLGITLVETARGVFPYPDFNNKCLFAQIELVVHGDPNFLNPGDNYEPYTVYFINRCLTKEYKDRPTFEELMRTEFFQHFSALHDRDGIVASYVQQMVELGKEAGVLDKFGKGS